MKAWRCSPRTHESLSYCVRKNIRQTQEQVLGRIRLGALFGTQAAVIHSELQLVYAYDVRNRIRNIELLYYVPAQFTDCVSQAIRIGVAEEEKV